MSAVILFILIIILLGIFAAWLAEQKKGRK